MKAVLKPCRLLPRLSLLLLCSCMTENSIRSQLPATVAMNKDAGRSQLIFVALRLEDGQALPCILDTGCAVTTLDQSLEPKLGKRCDTTSISTFAIEHEAGVYTAPRLYLDGALLLLTGTDRIFTCDFKWLSTFCGRPVMGILGCDVLQYYCIQLDFASHRIRFLDPDTPAKGLGQPFVLTGPPGEEIYVSNNLVGDKGSSSPTAIDLGCRGDGWLVPALFQQWTNQALPLASGQVHCPDAQLGGEIYPEVSLTKGEVWETGEPGHNGIGIFFLSRHLVTLNFPKRTMFLKRTRIGPLRPSAKEAKADAKSVATLLRSLKESGHLPGWSKDDQAVGKRANFFYSSALTGRFTARKIGDSSVYRFQVIRASEDSPWKLQKAWRTDEDGKTIEDFTMP